MSYLDRGITPAAAIEDFRWLETAGYWRFASFLEYTRSRWVPMHPDKFLTRMACTSKFHKGSKAYQFAVCLREARANI